MDSTHPWTSDRLAHLGCSWFDGFGARSLKKLRDGFGTWEEAWQANVSSLVAVGIAEISATRFVAWKKHVNPSTFAERLGQETIDVLFFEDTTYPSLLRTISHPPAQLFVRGVLPDHIAVSIVGTRRASSYGMRCVEMIVPELARAGVVIVSGLALGIDGEVHEQCLAASGITVAFLGSGVDNASLYPRAHLSLAKRILDGQGALVSEYPPGAQGRREHFPVRNRLIAGYAKATIVVECSLKSGSLITAASALSENREVLAIPGPIWQPTSEGPHTLLKAGAKPCTSAQDVLDALCMDQTEIVRMANDELPLDADERHIMSTLERPMTLDQLVDAHEGNVSWVLRTLTHLSLRGIIHQLPGQLWVKE